MSETDRKGGPSLGVTPPSESAAPLSQNDTDRAAILARRARLIAVALAGLAVTADCGAGTAPEPSEDGGQTDAPFRPCLEPPLEDSGRKDSDKLDAATDSDAPLQEDATPQPCLAPPV